jgi:hypothetical protein
MLTPLQRHCKSAGISAELNWHPCPEDPEVTPLQLCTKGALESAQEQLYWHLCRRIQESLTPLQ